MIEIAAQDVTFITDSLADDVGRVFLWQGRLLRGIRYDYVDAVDELLSSGLMQALIADGVFLGVEKTEFQLAGFGLILEHERIPVITYPYEWSFSMLKDAAVVMLRVNQIARDFGYQTKDGHGYNILFHGSRPVFIDLGSFIKVQPGHTGWQGYEEFLRFFYYPLKLWFGGNEFLAQRILTGAMLPLMPHDSYLAYHKPFTRYLNGRLRLRLARLPLLLRRVSSVPKEDIEQLWPGKKGRLLKWLRPFLKIGGKKSDLSALMNKVQRLQAKKQESMWGTYHLQSGVVDEFGKLRPSPRFKRIADLIDYFAIKDIIELAGNQGAFARYLLSATRVQSVICTDYDTNAIDRLYRALGSDQQAVTPAVLNFMSPVLLAETQPACQRMKAEGVVALAVVHHLLLTQRFSINKILSAICQYAKKYVFIEFMPLGLYAGLSEPNTPDWYRLDWFREACLRHFQILVEEQLEENRILFVGCLNSNVN